MPKFSIYLPDTESEKLDKMATTENRSVSNMVATLVLEGFGRRFVVKSIEALPRPDDAAQVVPVVTIEQAQ